MYCLGCVIIMLVYFWRWMQGREGEDVGKEGKGCEEGRGGMQGRERRDVGREGRDVGWKGRDVGWEGRDVGRGGRLVASSEGRPHIHPPSSSTPSILPPLPQKGVGLYALAYRPTPFFLVQFLSRMITDHSVINLDNSYIIIWSLVTILRAFPQYPLELLIIVRSFLEHCLIFIALGKKWWNDLECYWNDAQVLIL